MPDSGAAAITSSQKLRLFSQIGECERNNRPAEADSLFAVLDRYKALNLEDLLRWAHVRVVLNRYSGSAGLYSRVLGVDPQLIHIVYGQFSQLFENAPAESVTAALGTFQKDVFSRRGIDTLGLQLWLANLCARRGLDSAEMEVLKAVPATSQRLIPRLLDMARERYGRGFYAEAVLPAAVAYDRAGSPGLKTGAAALLYQAYQALRKNDSALVWLGRADLSNESRKTDAAALYQCAGRLSDAKALIVSLPPSFSRDTLELRQFLWNGDSRKAAELAEKGGREWLRRPDETLLWKVRTLLFDGSIEDLAAIFDTVSIAASWRGAKELIDYRFRLQLFNRSKEALSVWAHIEYDLFTGMPERAVRRFSERAVPAELKSALLLRIIRDLLEQGNTQAAGRLLEEQGEKAGSPEYLYRYAEVLLRNGQFDRARELLLRIIREYSGDVFSEKARVLLAKLQHRN